MILEFCEVMDESELKGKMKQWGCASRNSSARCHAAGGASGPDGSSCVRGTSVGANHRAACRARSRGDFLAKLAVVEEEADERGYWLELIVGGGSSKKALVELLLQEANELGAIIVASRKSATR